MPRDPFCSNCGYSLRGLTESSKCPECGKPIVEVLKLNRSIRRGKRYVSPIRLFGLPLVHIAFGPDEDEMYGKARGIIAIGDTARGWLAIGGRAFGIIAVGGAATGIFAIGGLAIGLIALGGGAIGVAACGGGAMGVVAHGGGAVGYVADGGGAVGYYARGAGVYAPHAIDLRSRDPQAVAFFDHWACLLGRSPKYGSSNPLDQFNLIFPSWLLAMGFLIAGVCALVLLASYWRQRHRE
jgi:predicted RNA-binding Zn-ribbon protein involved in translation (DUF1610 family)